MKKYGMAILAGSGTLLILNIGFNLIILAVGINSDLHLFLLTYKDQIYFPFLLAVGYFTFKHYKANEHTKSVSVDISVTSLTKQFHGRMLGELMLYKFEKTPHKIAKDAVMELIYEIPGLSPSVIMDWIDEFVPCAHDPYFWRKDCGMAYQEICGKAQSIFVKNGITPTDDRLLSMAELIFSNYVTNMHEDHRFLDFIRKSMKSVVTDDGKIVSAQPEDNANGRSTLLHIISARGEDEMWLTIGEDVSEKEYYSFMDQSTFELYGMQFFESGRLKTVLFGRRGWDVVMRKFDRIDRSIEQAAILIERNKILCDLYKGAMNDKRFSGIMKEIEL